MPKEKIDTEDAGLVLFKRIFVDFESPPTKKGEQNDILLRVTFSLQVGSNSNSKYPPENAETYSSSLFFQDEEMGTKIFAKLRDAFTRT